MKLGAHLSIVGGISKAAKRAEEVNANTLQIFSGSPRGWQTKKISQAEVKKFKKIASQYRLSPIFIHAKYLVNLASESKKIRQNSMNSLIFDLHLAAQIRATGVIFHPHPKDPKILTESIKQVLKKSPKSTFLILENSAQIRLEEIGKIIRTVKNPRLKFCLDLAHAYQAGYDLTDPKSLEKVFEIIKKEIGLDRLIVIHANDSRTTLGSKNDRHEDIGKGKLGPTPFFVFLNHPISSKLPFIIETPGFKEKGLLADRKNLKILKKLIGKKLNKEFFLQPTLEVAKRLLGKYLITNREDKFQIGRITETEAYIGPEDKASHAFRGKTKRNKIMWEEGGRLYVYLIYGVYHCLNIVTEKIGFPAAILIRAIEPIFGILGKTDGPGKLCRELGITQKNTGLDITKSNKIYIKDIGEKPKRIIATPRIGVDYAGEWAKKRWRFVAT